MFGNNSYNLRIILKLFRIDYVPFGDSGSFDVRLHHGGDKQRGILEKIFVQRFEQEKEKEERKSCKTFKVRLPTPIYMCFYCL